MVFLKLVFRVESIVLILFSSDVEVRLENFNIIPCIGMLQK